MISNWIKPVEQIILTATKCKARVLTLTSPVPQSGVSTVARHVAETLGRSGAKTLLLDLTRGVGESSTATNWAPGQPGAQKLIKPHGNGYDRLVYVPQLDTRYKFNNSELLRRTFDTEFAAYNAVVIDAPAVLDPRADRINAVAVATASDATFLTCLMGRDTHDDIANCAQMLKVADVEIAGIILNDQISPPLGADIARSVAPFVKGFPPLERMVEKYARA